MIFIDTNYFLRFFLKDIKQQYLDVKKLMLSAAQGEVKLFTSTVVFFEIYWVLHSYYGIKRDRLIKTLQEILGLEFIELPDRPILKPALKLFEETTLSLEDCYNLNFAREKKAKEFKTFDKKLGKTFLSLR